MSNVVFFSYIGCRYGGDVEAVLDTDETVGDFVMTYFGFKHDFVGYVVVIFVGIGVLFGFIFVFSIRVFNFQKR